MTFAAHDVAMDNSDPTVSVAIPTHNGAAHIAETIDSVLSQSLAPDELLVFDNASTDATAAIASRMLGDAAVITHPENIGAAGNFNACVERTHGELFMWLADDDRIRPEFIETCVEALRQDPEAAACLTGIQFTDSTGRPTRQQTYAELGSPDPRTRLRSFLRRRRWTETYCLYRRDHLERSPRFSDDGAADVLLTWWFLLRGPLAVVDAPLLEYREYPLVSVEQATTKAAESLNPDRERTHWNKVRLWRRLRAMTREPGIDPKVRRQARRELRLLATWPGIVFWVADDVLDRWPGIDHALRWVWVRLGSPGQIAPTS